MNHNASFTNDTVIDEHEVGLSEYARKLVSYSRAIHREMPSASTVDCIEMGAGKLIGEYGTGKNHLADIALSEVAAKWVFGQ